MTNNERFNSDVSRRNFLTDTLRGVSLLGLGAVAGGVTANGTAEPSVWQIDPDKCMHCEKCSTDCVLEPSAVKAVRAFPVCGYCELCTGFFKPDADKLEPGPANEVCPTGAFKRHYVEDPYYEYKIDEARCIGCAKCVDGCARFGNGSTYLQVRHDVCINCNQCAIARVCPGQAFVRVPASKPYLSKQQWGEA